MTNEQLRAEFEAEFGVDYHLEREGDGYKPLEAKLLWKGYQAARANSGWLQDAVIVLEEGAEPREGDWVKTHEDGNPFKYTKKLIIVRRNGLPVVYKTKELI